MKKTCLVCGAQAAVDAPSCPACGCCDFAPAPAESVAEQQPGDLAEQAQPKKRGK